MRKFISVLFLVFLAIATTPQASAHVEIVNSYPEQYSNVNPIPTEVWIEFSGNLQTLEGQAVNSVEVIDSTGIAVNYEDAVISGGRITTKISGQSAPGAFTVKYRVVGDDGHVIEGDYTFNASPDYAAGQSPMPVSSAKEESSIPAGGILLGALLIIFFGGIYMRAKKRST
ncbi:HATPase_CckA-like domain containing protein [Candidatus Nanopelagicaceae bacterium]